MLVSAVITLRPMQESTIPADQGRATYGLFLSWLRKIVTSAIRIQIGPYGIWEAMSTES
jgi:hypothetical protein